MSENIENLFGKTIAKVLAIILITLACLLLVCPPEQRPFLKEQLSNYKVNLGLDLKGGSELLYEVNPEEIDPSKSAEDVIDTTIATISQRILESGIVKEPRVQREQLDRILIQLPGLSKQDTEEIKKVIQTLGKLELRLVASPEVGVGENRLSEATERANYDEAKTKGQRALKRYHEKLRAQGYRWFPDKTGGRDYLLWIADPYHVTGDKFDTVKYDGLSQVIHFKLKSSGARDFKSLTTKYIKQDVAIVFNDKVMAAPKINSAIDTNGILEGFSSTEAQELIKTIRSGSLEIQPELLHENTIGPSLGEDSVRLGINAGLIGLAIVIVFILIYYLAAGLTASIALVLNVIIVFTLLVIFRETLTLPGIAGLILTVGMSIDANIIIFERIREEKMQRLLNNPNKEISKEELLVDIENGFSQAFSTIFDANVTTFLTALILYFIATGAVQGFAFTMLWGVVASFFTAIFVTRTLLDFLVFSGMVRKLSMMQFLKNPQFDTTNKMRAAAIFSLLLVLASAVIFSTSSDRIYGLDLRGGVLAEISLQKPLQTDDVRQRLRDDFRDDLEVQHIITDHLEGSSKNGWYQFSVRLPNVHQDEIEKLDAELEVIASEMSLLNRKLKDTQRSVVRSEQDKDDKLKVIRNIKKNDKDTEDLDSLRDQVRQLNEDIRADRDKERELEAEMQVKKDARKIKVDLKNEKAGIEELRDKINTKFTEELAPYPFSKIRRVNTGKYRNYVAIDVSLRTPVPVSFLEETTKEISSFDKVIVAVHEYNLEFSVPEGKGEKLEETITQHLELARPSLKPESFEVKQNEGLFTTVLSFNEAAPVETVNDAMKKCEFKDFTLNAKGVKENLVTNVTLLIDLPASKRSEPDELVQKFVDTTLREAFETAKYEDERVYFSDPFPRFSQISGVVAKAQKASAFRAIILSLVLILLYIAVRFPNGWRFGFGAVIALAHDVAITLGVVILASNSGLVNVEINLPVIAALLTIVGYSLNDTIVIFDRLRENQRKEEVWDRLGIKKVTEVYNTSINQTLSRTLLTSLTTFLVVAIIFGLNYGRGSVMEGFAFTLIIGVVVGTYSSIFVASSVVLKMESKNRKS